MTQFKAYLLPTLKLPVHKWQRLSIALLAALAATQIWAEALQSRASIRMAAEQFIANQPSVKALAAADITAQPLDKHLRLPACNQTLEAFLPPGAKLLGNTTAGVRCTGDKPWTLYVPVAVVAYGEVPTTARSLPRGATISAQDLVLTRQPLHLLPNGYLAGLDKAAGKQMTRTVPAGTLLTDRHVREPDLVDRGQQVTLVAGTDGYEIRVAGKALANGALGDRIRVRNISSRRIVEGTVAGPGIVRIGM